MGWIQDNWQIFLVVLVPACVGLLSLLVYRRSGNTNLLAAAVRLAGLATALLGGALWAAGVPQYLFGKAHQFTAG